MKLNSTELQIIHTLLDAKMRRAISKPACDYDEVVALARLTKRIDKARRIAWNKEKFGIYEEIANQVFPINKDFTSDDIPF